MKVSSFFFIVLLSFFANAQENCPPKENVLNLTNDVQNITQQLEPCKIEEQKEYLEAYDEFLNYFPEEGKSATLVIQGKSLIGSPDQLKIAEWLLSPPSVPNWQQKASSCSHVLCVFENLLGSKEASFRVFNIVKRNGYYLKLGPFSKGKDWQVDHQIYSTEEIRRLDGAFKKLPEELNHLKGLNAYYRMPDGAALKDTQGAAAWASRNYPPYSEGMIVFQEDTFKNSEYWTQHATIHETCHHLDFQSEYRNGIVNSESITFGFRDLSGWKKTKNNNGELEWVYKPEQSKFVTNYAATKPLEDFAESCAYYVHDPNELLKKAPEKYDFMKNKVFHGKEFKKTDSSSLNNTELEKIFEDPTRCSYLATQCLDKFVLDSSLKIQGNKSKGEKSPQSWNIPDDWYQDSDCFKITRDKITDEISRSIFSSRRIFCSLGGKIGISNLMRQNFCKKTFANLISQCASFKDLIKTGDSGCISKKDFTSQCLIDAYLASGKINLGISTDAARKFLNMFQNKAPPLKSVLDQHSSAMIVINCVKNADRVFFGRSSSDNDPFLFIGQEKNTGLVYGGDTHFNYINPCLISTGKFLKDHGYKLDEEEEKNQLDALFTEKQLRKAFVDFLAIMFDLKNEAEKNCGAKLFGKKKCIDESFSARFDKWWNMHGNGQLSLEDKDVVMQVLLR